jgi:hypothetical protein
MPESGQECPRSGSHGCVAIEKSQRRTIADAHPFHDCIPAGNFYAESMNVPRRFSRCFLTLPALAVLALLLWGCATAKVDWEARLGTYTHDQAILDYGPPDRSATLTDGSKVDEWLLHRGYTRGAISTVGGSHYGAPWIHHYAEPPSPDQVLRLTFSPEGKLKAWRKVLK